MELRVFLLIGIPLIGCFFIPVVSKVFKRDKPRDYFALFLALITNALAWTLLPAGLSGETKVWTIKIWSGLDGVFILDALAVFMAITSSSLSFLIVLYSIGYMHGKDYLNEYYLVMLMFIGAMMGLVVSVHLIFMYIFWEIAALACWRLIGFYRERDFVSKGVKAFIVTFLGAIFMLLGFILIYAGHGTFDLTKLRGVALGTPAVILILLGMLSKSATLPFHTWLPDAGVAPSTVTSLLHAAVLVKIGVYAFARIFDYNIVLSVSWQEYVIWIGLISAIVSGCAALVSTNIKRILAYSTVSQIGYIFMGLACFNAVGVGGALLYILMHGIAKGGLFLAAGVIEHSTGTKDITRMGGLIKYLPFTAVAFLINMLSIIGVPPLGGFFSKFMVIQGIMKSGNTMACFLAMFTAVLTLVYLLRLFNLVFLGEPKDNSLHPHREGTPVMVWVVVFLALCSVIAGILVQYPMDLIQNAIRDISQNPVFLIK